jgi:hypothetical protein
VVIFLAEADLARHIPPFLENVPIVVHVTGEIVAVQDVKHHNPGHGRGGGGGGGGENPYRHARPVPIGVSTGNEGECSAGTIGVRLIGGNNVYALSNNHVYALTNSASLGSRVLQPGRYDNNCVLDPNDEIGTLSDYEPIIFGGAENVIDAAIALSSTAALGNSTPPSGYGTPTSEIYPMPLNSGDIGLPVQKFGRTTDLTTGRIAGINATIRVNFGVGIATFVNQVVVDGDGGGFLRSGDSGSLLVSDPARQPIGLLFAADRSGKTAFANPIDHVLARFGLEIDGE